MDTQRIDQLRDLTIYIPTLGRVERQPTWDFLSPTLKQRTQLLCTKEECKKHKELGRNVLYCPVQGKLERVRQWALVTCSTPYLLFLDDDLVFYRRREKGSLRHRNATAEEWEDCVLKITRLLSRGYVHVGVCARHEFQHLAEKCSAAYTFLGRSYQVQAFLAPAVCALGVRFSPLAFEDFGMTLQLLLQGYTQPYIVEYPRGQKYGSQAAGGCENRRSKGDYLERSAKAFAQQYPAYVQAVFRKNKVSWGELKDRWDVKVFWRAALQSAEHWHGDYSDPLFQSFVEKTQCRTGLLFPPRIVIHEQLYSGEIRHGAYSLTSWQRSLSDTDVQYRWTHREGLDCRC